MLILSAHQSAVLFVAKDCYHSDDLPLVEKLQLAIALVAGLSNHKWVEMRDVLRQVAATHDTLSAAELLPHPATKILDSLGVLAMMPQGTASLTETFLMALMSNLTCMQVQEGEHRLVNWKSNLPASFSRDFAARVAAAKMTTAAV